MSINLDTGLWQCFKTSSKGNFLKLYAKLENISYYFAYRKFLVEEFFAEEEFRVVKDEVKKGKLVEEISEEMKHWKPLGAYMEEDDELVLRAKGALLDRGFLDFYDYYVAVDGNYKNRLIIPYVNNPDLKPFYFQARALLPGQEPKYLNFRGMKSSSILYPFDYESTQPLYVCEGAFDAISLHACGLNATTTISCHVSKEQIEQLKFYQGPVVVAFDNDKAGRDGLRSFEMQRRRGRLAPINYIFPPKESKDWNDFYVKNPTKVKDYLSGYKKFNLNEWDTMTALETLGH